MPGVTVERDPPLRRVVLDTGPRNPLGIEDVRALGPDCGEIKAMRTADAHRRRGVGSRILEHILGEARRRGYRRVFLETGAMPEFALARALYGHHGFSLRGPFGDYADDPNSVFMALELAG